MLWSVDWLSLTFAPIPRFINASFGLALESATHFSSAIHERLNDRRDLWGEIFSRTRSLDGPTCGTVEWIPQKRIESTVSALHPIGLHLRRPQLFN